MRWDVRLSEAAENDIADVLQWTLDQFGQRQHDQYRQLIRDAIDCVGKDPTGFPSRARSDLHPDARTLHISQRGKPARHFFVYKVDSAGVVRISRMLHDAMQIGLHLPDDFSAS